MEDLDVIKCGACNGIGSLPRFEYSGVTGNYESRHEQCGWCLGLGAAADANANGPQVNTVPRWILIAILSIIVAIVLGRLVGKMLVWASAIKNGGPKQRPRANYTMAVDPVRLVYSIPCERLSARSRCRRKSLISRCHVMPETLAIGGFEDVSFAPQ